MWTQEALKAIMILAQGGSKITQDINDIMLANGDMCLSNISNIPYPGRNCFRT